MLTFFNVWQKWVNKKKQVSLTHRGPSGQMNLSVFLIINIFTK